MRIFIVGLVLSSLFLMGCTNLQDKQSHRDAQIEIVDRQMIARQRMELDRAQAQAQWAAAMAAVAAASPENADAIAVGLAVAAVKNADEGGKNMPVVTLQRDTNNAQEWAKILAAPMLNTVTQLGLAGINARVLTNDSDNDARIQMNEDTVDGQQFQVLGNVAEAVSGFGTTALQNAGGNTTTTTTTTYTVSDEAMLDMSVDNSVSGDTNTDSYNTSGDTNTDSYNQTTSGDTNADSYNTQGDTTTDSSDNSDNSDNSVTNPAGP